MVAAKSERKFRWYFGIDAEKEEFEVIPRICADCDAVTIEHEGQKRLVSFEELSGKSFSEAWDYGIWSLIARLNLRLKAFMFAAREVKLKGWIYEKREEANRLFPVHQMIYAASGGATFVSPVCHAEWEILLDIINRELKVKMPGLGATDDDFWQIINRLSSNDFKDFYIAYEQICRSYGVPSKNFQNLSVATGISKDRLSAFWRTANDLHRHHAVRPPPPNVMDVAEAKVLMLSLFVAWMRRR